MKSLDYTLEKLPGHNNEMPYAKMPIINPIPILQQPKSEIITNPFIVPFDKYHNIVPYDLITTGSTTPTIITTETTTPTISTTETTPSNSIMPTNFTTNSTTNSTETTIENHSFSKIVENTSITFVGILDDIYRKPDDVSWLEYIRQIVVKNNRFNYIAIILFFIVLYILLVK